MAQLIDVLLEWMWSLGTVCSSLARRSCVTSMRFLALQLCPGLWVAISGCFCSSLQGNFGPNQSLYVISTLFSPCNKQQMLTEKMAGTSQLLLPPSLLLAVVPYKIMREQFHIVFSPCLTWVANRRKMLHSDAAGKAWNLFWSMNQISCQEKCKYK